MIICIDAKKVFDKIQHTFKENTSQKLGIEGIYLNIIKGIYEKSQLKSYWRVKRWKHFLLGEEQEKDACTCKFYSILYSRS